MRISLAPVDPAATVSLFVPGASTAPPVWSDMSMHGREGVTAAVDLGAAQQHQEVQQVLK